MSLIEKVIEFVTKKLSIEIKEENKKLIVLYLMNFILILKTKFIGTF